MTSFVGFNPTFKTQFDLDFAGKIIVDFFAGGGGEVGTVRLGTDLARATFADLDPSYLASLQEAGGAA